MDLDGRGGDLVLGFALTLAGAPAQAACPDVDAEIRSAESDVFSYFLADAQKALDRAVEGMACSGPVTAEQHSRYWQVQAMLFDFQGDDRADAAFVASKRRGTEHFLADWGDAIRTRWDALAVPDAPRIPLVLKGLEGEPTVWLDGQPVAALEAPAGFHLLQVGLDAPRFARAVVFPDTGELVVALPPEATTPAVPIGPAPAPAPEPVGPAPAPAPEPVGPAPVAPVSARKKLRQNSALQVGALGLAAVAGYSTYLFAWQELVGRGGNATGGLIASGTALVGAGVLEVGLLRARRKHRDPAARTARLTPEP